MATHRIPLTVFGGSDRAVVTLAGREIAIFRNDGRIHAFANACPHEGNPLAHGEIRGETLRCAYHLWEFDLETGDCLAGEAPAKTYPAEISGGEIIIDL